MKKFVTTLFLLTAFATAAAAQCVSLNTMGTAATEDFNTLASSGTSTVTPTGWYFLETLTNANTTYTAGTGSSTTGDTYSFGAAGSGERAFGTLQSGNLLSTIGACFTNNTGLAINVLTISYTGEQWRQGGTNRQDRLDFQYSLDATSLSTGTWTDDNTLDFLAPNTGTVTGAYDGNAAANRALLTDTISGLNIAPGATVWIRWSDFNAAGADDGLGVDDFSITPNPGATPSLKSSWGTIKTLYR
jgi:hypothetical protein